MRCNITHDPFAQRVQSERGAALILVSICLIALLGIVSFAVDLSVHFLAQQRKSLANDIAVLAGAALLQEGYEDAFVEQFVAHTVGANAGALAGAGAAVTRAVVSWEFDRATIRVESPSALHHWFSRILGYRRGTEITLVSAAAVSLNDPEPGGIHSILATDVSPQYFDYGDRCHLIRLLGGAEDSMDDNVLRCERCNITTRHDPGCGSHIEETKQFAKEYVSTLSSLDRLTWIVFTSHARAMVTYRRMDSVGKGEVLAHIDKLKVNYFGDDVDFMDLKIRGNINTAVYAAQKALLSNPGVGRNALVIATHRPIYAKHSMYSGTELKGLIPPPGPEEIFADGTWSWYGEDRGNFPSDCGNHLALDCPGMTAPIKDGWSVDQSVNCNLRHSTVFEEHAGLLLSELRDEFGVMAYLVNSSETAPSNDPLKVSGHMHNAFIDLVKDRRYAFSELTNRVGCSREPEVERRGRYFPLSEDKQDIVKQITTHARYAFDQGNPTDYDYSRPTLIDPRAGGS